MSYSDDYMLDQELPDNYIMADKKEKFLTPVGEAKWAYLHEPKPPYKDKNGTEKGGPKYQLDVVFDPKEPAWSAWGKALMGKIAALPQQTQRGGDKIPKQVSIKKELDDNDKETGRYYVTFKTGEQYKPGVFDKYNQPLPEGTKVGNGSKVRVSYTEAEYDAFGGGITLYLGAVQVLDLVEFHGRNAEAYGFEAAPMEDDPFGGVALPGDSVTRPYTPSDADAGLAF